MSSSNVSDNNALVASFATQVNDSIQKIKDIASSEEKPGAIQHKTDDVRDELNEVFLTTFAEYDVSADTGASAGSGLADVSAMLKAGLSALRGKALALTSLASDLVRFETSLFEVQDEKLGEIHDRLRAGGQLTQNESLNIAFHSICQAITKRVTDVTEKTGSSVDDQSVVSDAKDLLGSAAKKAVEFRKLTGSCMAEDAGPTGEEFSAMKANTMVTLREADAVLAAKEKQDRH